MNNDKNIGIMEKYEPNERRKCFMKFKNIL